MKKVKAVFLGIAVLLAVGCEKEDDTNNVTPDPAPESYSKCQLASDRVDTLTSKYTYDAQGKLLEKAYAYGIERFEYNSFGKISKWIKFNSRLDTNSVDIYEYNNDSLPIKIISRSGLTPTGVINLWGTQTITYDAQKRISSRFSYEPGQPATLVRKMLYSYPGNNEITMQAWEFIKYNNTWKLHFDAQMTYDNNKTPWGEGTPYNFLVDHNELSYAAQFHQPSYSHSRTSTYTFNAAGYPIERIDVTDGRHTTRSTYTYNCK